MYLTVKREWTVTNASKGTKGQATIPPGRHEVERIPDPFGCPNSFWIVLKGTQIGMNEVFWTIFQNKEDPETGKLSNWGSWEVIIEE